MADLRIELAAALRSQFALCPGQSVYAVADGAQDLDLVKEAVQILQKEAQSLFQGESAEAMASVAPYLIALDAASNVLDLWASRWGNNAGLLLTTRVDSKTLFDHLRKIFVVQDESEQEYFFRFYDPRVLRVYLPTCTSAEASDFFGPVSCFFVEGSQPRSLLKFSRGSAGAMQESVTLLPPLGNGLSKDGAA